MISIMPLVALPEVNSFRLSMKITIALPDP
jgi:hypothetical protein